MTNEKMGNESLEIKPKSTPKAIKIMEDVATRFRMLINESDEALNRRNREEYISKSRESANLLIGLPDQLKEAVNDLDENTKYSVIRQVETFASVAKRLLDSHSFAGMSAILNTKGDRIDDRNDLEKLIDKLRQRN
ncbi:MAG: hypothetical protein UU31_C0003G0003 [Candidatus Uhrbacteria bacterium GW2011_GWA2_41_10]|jgi:hypothetical protein|nr:MAG: hypothetical protein UU31_C0003G0003 [Candidatus Uhrbacteria bacterium GW2011_GWA2_41_10]